jgi:hypothetical protein
MKLALVTIVTAHLEQLRTFYQEVLQIEPETYRGNYVAFATEAAPSPCGASQSVQSMGSVLCQARRMTESLLSLRLRMLRGSMPG